MIMSVLKVDTKEFSYIHLHVRNIYKRAEDIPPWGHYTTDVIQDCKRMSIWPKYPQFS